MSRRPPAVAGRFYPADPQALRATVDRLLAAVPAPDGPLASGYVVPHAGLRYSGAVAATVYARLGAHAAAVRTVVLVGPTHYVPLRGCAVPTTQVWSTPLGELPVAAEAARELVARQHAGADDEPHAAEHSLEVQLPFLQRAVPQAEVLPIAVGRAGPAEVSAVISAALAACGPGTVLLCSTDLSHYLTQDEALVADRATIEAVLARDPLRIAPRAACGLFALRGLVAWAVESGLQPALLEHRTSFATTGDAGRVVGYGAFAVG